MRRDSAALRPWANGLSLARIALGVAVYLTVAGGVAGPGEGDPLLDAAHAAVALALTLTAALTDYLDGLLARRAPPEATRFAEWFGRWIDAFTDFCFFLAIYSALLRIGVMPAWLYALFLAREGTMYLILRPAARRLALDHGARLPGKIKTVLQYAGVSGLLGLAAAAPYLGVPAGAVHATFPAALTVLVAVSVGSLYWYWRPLVGAWPARESRLPRQLPATVVGLALLQILLYAVLAPLPGGSAAVGVAAAAAGGGAARWDLFLIVICLFHVLIGWFLFWRHDEFVPLRDEEFAASGPDGGSDAAAGEGSGGSATSASGGAIDDVLEEHAGSGAAAAGGTIADAPGPLGNRTGTLAKGAGPVPLGSGSGAAAAGSTFADAPGPLGNRTGTPAEGAGPVPLGSGSDTTSHLAARPVSLSLPNLLSLLRLSSIPTLTLLLAHGPRPGTAPLLVTVIAVVFLTDLLDGALARRRGQVTRIGGYLDSGSDYLVLLALAVLLATKGIMPQWLALLLVARLVLHALAMGVVVLRRGAGVVGPTTWGKISVAAAMVVIGLELLVSLLGAGDAPPALLDRVLGMVEVAAALLIGVSLIDKVRYFLEVMGPRR